MLQAKNTVNRFIRNPFLIWVFSPLPLLFAGVVLGAKQQSFQFYPTLLLYLFLLCTTILERYLIKKQQRQIDTIPTFGGVALLFLALFIFLFSNAVNIVAAFLLLLYLIFLFITYHQQLGLEQTMWYLLLQAFFQAIILNQVAFYAQTSYLTIHLIPFLLPIALLLSLTIVFKQKNFIQKFQENDFYQRILKKKLLLFLMGLYGSSLFVIFLLFQATDTVLRRQLAFFLFQVFYLTPLAFTSFRQQIRTNTYLSILSGANVILYASLLTPSF